MAGKGKKKNEIVEVLMKRDGMTEAEARKALADAREAFDPETDDFGEFMASEFGLEEDYIFDFLG